MEIDKLKLIAFKLHEDAGMLYNGMPYSVHLEMVHSFFVKYKKYIKKYASDVEIALYFHDAKEDCGITHEHLVSIIGEIPAAIVENVSNEDGKNRKEKLTKTLPKIASTYESIFLKLCDRLANITYSLEEKKKTITSNMCNVYIKEYPIFRYYLKMNSWFDEMWDELDAIIGYEDSTHIAIVKNDITTLINTKRVIEKPYYDSYNIEAGRYMMEEPKEIDVLIEKIRKYVMDNLNILPVDFIVESLSDLGHAPNILYDDNGMFAVTSDSVQTVHAGDPVDMTMSFMVTKRFWKPSIREALVYYLTNEDEEDEYGG